MAVHGPLWEPKKGGQKIRYFCNLDCHFLHNLVIIISQNKMSHSHTIKFDLQAVSKVIRGEERDESSESSGKLILLLPQGEPLPQKICQYGPSHSLTEE